jgi:hypothetical protein
LIKLDSLLQKELTRKQFVQSIFAAVVGMAGITAFLGAFTKDVSKPAASDRPGYGNQGYGP